MIGSRKRIFHSKTVSCISIWSIHGHFYTLLMWTVDIFTRFFTWLLRHISGFLLNFFWSPLDSFGQDVFYYKSCIFGSRLSFSLSSDHKYKAKLWCGTRLAGHCEFFPVIFNYIKIPSLSDDCCSCVFDWSYFIVKCQKRHEIYRLSFEI